MGPHKYVLMILSLWVFTTCSDDDPIPVGSASFTIDDQEFKFGQGDQGARFVGLHTSEHRDKFDQAFFVYTNENDGLRQLLTIDVRDTLLREKTYTRLSDDLNEDNHVGFYLTLQIFDGQQRLTKWYRIGGNSLLSTSKLTITELDTAARVMSGVFKGTADEYNELGQIQGSLEITNGRFSLPAFTLVVDNSKVGG